jgi:uncharacterized membrane protein
VIAAPLLGKHGPVAVRLAAALPVGVATALLVGATVGWGFAPAVGWIVTATVYLIWTWSVVTRLDPDQTAPHATREDPTRAMTDLIVIAAAMASLAGVGYLLTAGSSSGREADIAAFVGVLSVAASWFAVHTVFTLRYTRLYYGTPGGGVDFHQEEPPTYADFAYLGFTIGMTFQVSDTDLGNRRMRGTALRQALLSYLLGAVILAITVNLVAGLGHPGP